MPDLAARLTRIDAAIACHEAAAHVAYGECCDGECAYHRDEVTRLTKLRSRVEQGHGRMTG